MPPSPHTPRRSPSRAHGRVRRRALATVALVAALAAGSVAVVARSGHTPASDPDPAAPVAAATPGPRPVPERPCDHKATNGDELASAFEAADGGETVCLASGNFGTFRGGIKPSVVNVQPEPGARPRLALDFDGAVNVRVDGVTVKWANIRGPSRDVTVADSRFTGLAVVNADQMADADVVFDANLHADVDTCRRCFQGRLHVEGDSGSRSGVVIANSVFSGGNSDGIRADANGVEILDNEIFGLQDQDPFHADPIQIYGGTGILIRGNYIHDNNVSAGIMMADGGRDNVVEDNVIAGGGMTWAMTWHADDGSIIRHNTFADGECAFARRCGIINIGAKAANEGGRGTIIRDNVLGGVSNGGGDMDATFAADHNLSRDPLPGEGNVQGLAAYSGPLDTRAGHRLAKGSPGARQASDGADTGIRR